MEKLVLTLTQGLFALGMSGFGKSNIALQSHYCMNLRHDVFAFHYTNGSGISERWTETIEVYERCENRRGNY